MKRKETYLSRDFRDTAAQRFPAQAKQLNAAFDILHTQILLVFAKYPSSSLFSDTP